MAMGAPAPPSKHRHHHKYATGYFILPSCYFLLSSQVPQFSVPQRYQTLVQFLKLEVFLFKPIKK